MSERSELVPCNYHTEELLNVLGTSTLIIDNNKRIINNNIHKYNE